MKRDKKPQMPLHDYRIALQGAVSWLGDRYLLAEPTQRRQEPAKDFFAQQPRWMPTR